MLRYLLLVQLHPLHFAQQLPLHYLDLHVLLLDPFQHDRFLLYLPRCLTRLFLELLELLVLLRLALQITGVPSAQPQLLDCFGQFFHFQLQLAQHALFRLPCLLALVLDDLVDYLQLFVVEAFLERLLGHFALLSLS